MNPRGSALLTAPVLVVCGHGAHPQSATELTALVTNLTRLASPGAVGAVVSAITSNDPWQLIVSGDEDTTAPSSFCLARTCGSGRVVALGHDGIMLEKVHDDAQSHRNVARWLNRG